MVNLTYDFKKLEKKLNWNNADGLHIERNQKFNNLIRAFKIMAGIKAMVVFDLNGVNIRRDDETMKGFKNIYLEVHHRDLTVRVRHLTYSTEKYINELDTFAESVLKAEFKYFISDNPCNKCGKKQFTNGYDGICMDCADELGVSELFVEDKNYEQNLEKAQVFLNSFQRKVGSSRFIVPHPKILGAIKGLENDGLLTQKEGVIKLTGKGQKAVEKVHKKISGGLV